MSGRKEAKAKSHERLRSLDQPLQRGISLRKQLLPKRTFSLFKKAQPALEDNDDDLDEEEKAPDPVRAVPAAARRRMPAPEDPKTPHRSDAESMEVRRQLEFQLIKANDKTEINVNRGEYWYLVPAVWMRKWIGFLVNKGPLPGPVSMMDFFDFVPTPPTLADVAQTSSDANYSTSALGRKQSGGSNSGTTLSRESSVALMSLAPQTAVAGRSDLRLKAGLNAVDDYRCVTPMMWFLMMGLYGTDGGPEVCRFHSDLYGPDVTAIARLRVSSELKAKADTELKRYAAFYNVSITPPPPAGAANTLPSQLS